MTLKEIYEAAEVSEKERIPAEKNVVLVVPEPKRDVSKVVKALGLARCEVALTWPKKGLELVDELIVAAPKMVVQVGQRFTRKYSFVVEDENGVTDEMREAAAAATADAFVGLHHHDEFSVKDGLGTVDQLVKMLKAQRRSFCCVTNHGNVGGWIKQHNACKKAGIKALYGCEFYVSDYRGDDPEQKKAHRSANHLVLVARTKEGFDNIIRIHNDAQMYGFYYTPRADHAVFKKWGKGIVGTTACMAGEIPQALMAGDRERAKELWKMYSEAFDEFYVELQIIEFEEQRAVNRALVEFAREVGAPMTLSCDSHYLEAEHAETHDLLMCIRQGKTVMDRAEDKADVWSFDVRNLYYRDADQMWEVFAGGFVEKDGTSRSPFMDDVFTQDVFMEAMANTRRIAVEAEDISLDSAVKMPKLYDDGKAMLKKKVNLGFTAMWENKMRQEDNAGIKKEPEELEAERNIYKERAVREFNVITKLGWTDYFLVMEKIVSATKKEHGEWAVGYGRGSAAGSLVSYCLGLTDVDPIEYGLLFERFLDEGRGGVKACTFEL